MELPLVKLKLFGLDFSSLGLIDEGARPASAGWAAVEIDEPFLIYGPGLHNFLMTNDRLICMFILLAALALV